MKDFLFTDLISFVGEAPKKFTGYKKYVSTGAVNGNIIESDDTELVEYSSRPSRANLVACSGDILFAKMAETEKTLLLDDETEKNIYSTGFCAIRAKENIIEPKALYYLLGSSLFLNQKNTNSSGATQRAITNTGLSKIRIKLPTMEKQREFCGIMDKVVDSIELRKKQLGYFDKFTKSLFIEMFGDLFTNPMNWNKQPLGAICNKVIRYPTFYGMEYLETGIKVIRIGNILADGRMDLDDKKYVFVDDIVNKDFPETIIDMNDIIMAVRGDGSAAKRIGIIREPQLVGANISPNLIRIKVDCNKLNPIYMFYYLTGEVGQKYLDVYVNKTAKKNIAAKDIVKVSIYVPPLDLQNRFADYVSSIDKSKLAVKKSLEELEVLKKSLMQKYFA